MNLFFWYWTGFQWIGTNQLAGIYFLLWLMNTLQTMIIFKLITTFRLWFHKNLKLFSVLDFSTTITPLIYSNSWIIQDIYLIVQSIFSLYTTQNRWLLYVHSRMSNYFFTLKQQLCHPPRKRSQIHDFIDFLLCTNAGNIISIIQNTILWGD